MTEEATKKKKRGPLTYDEKLIELHAQKKEAVEKLRKRVIARKAELGVLERTLWAEEAALKRAEAALPPPPDQLGPAEEWKEPASANGAAT